MNRFDRPEVAARWRLAAIFDGKTYLWKPLKENLQSGKKLLFRHMCTRTEFGSETKRENVRIRAIDHELIGFAESVGISIR